MLVRRQEVRDRDPGAAEPARFTSALLPRWARRTRRLDALPPVLYLRGISTGDFQEALAALLGRDAPDRARAEAAIAVFAEKYEAKYPKAIACLTRDREAFTAFFDFPAEHWDHLRTANPIESVFATVRHRTVRTKGTLSQKTPRLMVFKLVMAALKAWRRLNGENRLPMVLACVTFTDGVAATAASDHRAA